MEVPGIGSENVFVFEVVHVNGDAQHRGKGDKVSAALQIYRGKCNDAPAFDALYKSLNPDNVLEAIAMDKEYDSDHIHDTQQFDGIEPVFPPRENRRGQYPYTSKDIHDRKVLRQSKALISCYTLLNAFIVYTSLPYKQTHE
jgi:hypothetical protein